MNNLAVSNNKAKSQKKEGMKKPMNEKKTTVAIAQDVALTTKIGIIIGMISAFFVGMSFIYGFFAVASSRTTVSSKPPAPVYNQNQTILFAPDQVLVKFKEGVSETDQQAIVKGVIEKPIPVRVNKTNNKVIQEYERGKTQDADTEVVSKTAKIKKFEAIYPKVKSDVELLSEVQGLNVEVPKTTSTAPSSWTRATLIEETDVATLVRRFQENKNVAYAQPNYIHRLYYTPNDPYYSSSGSWGQNYADMWGIKQINSSQGWDTNINFSVKRGDVNRDQEINMDDVTMLANYILKGSAAPNPVLLGDVNNDGRDTLADVIYLANYVNKKGPAPVGTNFGTVPVVTAVVDTGIDYNHPDIKANIWTNIKEIAGNGIDDDANGFIDDVQGWDFASGTYGDTQDNDPMDRLGHGTHVAGTIAAVTNNGVGVSGMCRGCTIMAVKAATDNGILYSDAIAKALEYAANNGAKVINNSWGGVLYDQLIQDAIDQAYGKGAVLVFAAGNSNTDANFFYPKSDKLIKVAASGTNGATTSFTNYGAWIDVAAPGDDILSLRASGTDMYGDGKQIVGTNYYRASGTSMAAPHVVGAIALILSQYPGLSQEEVRSILRNSADDINEPGWDMRSGYGRLNVYKALNILQPCTAYISLPTNWQNMADLQNRTIDVKGTASCKHFVGYAIEYGTGAAPSSWTNLKISSSPVNDGILSSGIDTSSWAPGGYTVKLTVKDSSGKEYVDRAFVRVSPSMHPGFPISVETSHILSPSVADLNNDGADEIILPPYVLNQNGTAFPGWPANLTYANYDFSNAAIGDIDPSYPGQEVVFITSNISGSEGTVLHIFHADGKEIVNNQWPKQFYSFSYIPTNFPVLADVDADGRLEIIVNTSKVFIWKLDGTSLSGWPKDLTAVNEENQVSVGNVDMDPQLELTVSNLILDSNGAILAKLPNCPGSLTSPLADIDQDGKDEVVCSEFREVYEGMKFKFYLTTVAVFKPNGSRLPGWPRTFTYPDISIYITPYILPTVVNLTGDSAPEILAAIGDYLYVFDSSGNQLPGWPALFRGYFNANPLVADIDGDKDTEIIVGSIFNTIMAYHHNGMLVEGYPIILPHPDYLQFGTPALSDLDKDKRYELVGYNRPLWGLGAVSVFDLFGGQVPGTDSWTQTQGDAGKTGHKNVL